jgi:hypothetical protein
MKNLLIFLLTLGSLNSFAETMTIQKKEHVVREILLKKLGNIKIEDIEVSFAEFNIMYGIPVVGQVMALINWGGEGDKDWDEVHVRYTKNNTLLELNCNLITSKTKKYDELQNHIGYNYSLKLHRCNLENIDAGRSIEVDDSTYIFASKRWSYNKDKYSEEANQNSKRKISVQEHIKQSDLGQRNYSTEFFSTNKKSNVANTDRITEVQKTDESVNANSQSTSEVIGN